MVFHYLDLAWRNIKQTPLVSTLMIAAIGIGIGVTMTALSIYHMMSSNPMSHKGEQLHHPQLQIIAAGNDSGSLDGIPEQLTFRDAEYLLNHGPADEQVAMFKTGYSLHLEDQSVDPVIKYIRVTSSAFFSMFDVDFLAGGTWTKEQENNLSQVVVINEEIAKRFFGRIEVVGESIYLNDRLFKVVGVIGEFKPHIKFYDVNNSPFSDTESVFIPFSLTEALEIYSWGNTSGWHNERIESHLDLLNSEQTFVQFWANLDSEAQVAEYKNFLLNYIQEQKKLGRFPREVPEYALRDLNTWLEYNRVVEEENEVLVGLSFMFFAVCLANILGMLLSKFLKRAPDSGVRRALGASKLNIFIQHQVEVGCYGVIGSIVGILIAQLGLWWIRDVGTGYQHIAKMDLTMLMTAPLITLLGCIVAGLYPAWKVCHTPPATHLKVQ